MSNLDVLIVGAGPVGLSLGCELLRHGLTCRVIDMLDAPVIYSKAAVVHARTMEIFAKLDIAEAIRKRATLIHGISAYAEGQRVSHVVLDEIESPFPHIYGVSQHDTEAILTQRLIELGGTVERSLRLASFTQDAAGVCATLVHKDGQTQTVQAAWLVGCDGAHSTVRHALNLAFEGAPYEEKLIQTDVRVDWPRHVEKDEILIFLAPDGPIACFPFFQDGRYRVIKIYTDKAPEGEPSLSTFQQALEAQLPEVRLSDPAWIIGFRIHHRLAEHFGIGRVFLAGDAVHVHSPTGGQGMNTGIQDAHNLAWKLALVARGRALPSLLDSYEAERRPIAKELLRGTDLATRAVEQVVKLRHPLALSLRNGFMSLMSRLDFVRSNVTRSISMLARNYRQSPIVAEHRQPLWKSHVRDNFDSELPSLAAWSAFGNGPEPGDRAPNISLHDGSGKGPADLYAVLVAQQHTLLLFDGEASTAEGYANLAQIAERVQKHFGDLIASYLVVPHKELPASAAWQGNVLIDGEKALHERYGARSECLYLIRPDGHIAYRSQPAAADKLFEYLSTLYVAQA